MRAKTIKNSSKYTSQAIFDTLQNLSDQKPPTHIKASFVKKDFSIAKEFLQQYNGNVATYNAYRREIERLLQWSWLIVKKSLLKLRRTDIEDYVKFCQKPPKSWIAMQQENRFIVRFGERVPNKNWRPFVATTTKVETEKGIKPDKDDYSLSQKAVKEIFTVLSSFYNYLISENVTEINPVSSIRQKSKFLRKYQDKPQIRRLSEDQWKAVINSAKQLATTNPDKHERTLFILTILYLMYLRISELVATDRWQPQMGHFYNDSNNNWWFKTVGKGNKERHVAVSDKMLTALKRYRKSRKLTPMPLHGETTPLIHKLIGKGNITSTVEIRRIVQEVFDLAVKALSKDGHRSDAATMRQATVHWLRHTGISDDINKRHRPIAHVRDDAGHSSSGTTDKYNDIELKERHASARDKQADG